MSIPWQLLVHSDPDVVEQVDHGLDRLPPTSPEITPFSASNLAEARSYMRRLGTGECRLLIIGAATPADRRSSVGSAGREPTKEFIKEVKKVNPRLPIILLSSTPDEPLIQFMDAFDNTRCVAFSTTLLDALLPMANEMRRLLPPKPRGEVLEVDIFINDERQGSYLIVCHGANPYHYGNDLNFDAQTHHDVLRKSRLLQGEVDRIRWKDDFADLASELDRLLFSQNHNFRTAFTRWVGKMGAERTRIRFTLNEKTYPVLVEALREPDTMPKYFMLQAPVFRRYDMAAARYPLFKDPRSRAGPIDCLMVEADPDPGEIATGSGRKAFGQLSQIAAECSDIATLLRNAGAAHGIGRVDHLRLGPGDTPGEAKDVRQALLDRLGQRPWHVVHFAGHVMHDRDAKSANLVLSASRGAVLDMKDFVDRLPGAQFVFLSSCRSADSYVVMNAAEAFVPAILGFRWTVRDDAAASFARAFYRELFDESDSSYKYLEYAFRDARKATYDENNDDSTWASPVLVMQLEQSPVQATREVAL